MLHGIVSHATEQGYRDYQEDRFFCAAVPSVCPTGWLLAVMDGHGGAKTADFCAREMQSLFSACLNAGASESILRTLVIVLHGETRSFREGSTLSIAWVREDRDEVTVAV